jgi:hypothetical protein
MLRFFKTKKVKASDQKKRSAFPVLIGTPIPIMDFKENSTLSTFIAMCSARRLALPYPIPSRQSEFGRNAIIPDFLNQPERKIHSHLMFVDADSCPADFNALDKMLSLDRDVVCGVTPLWLDKGEIPDLRWNVQTGSGGNLAIGDLPQEPFKVDRVGGTCILIKRKVLEALKPPYQRPSMNEAYTAYSLSEDYYFCDKIREAGFEIWCDPTIMNHHWHTIDILRILTMIQELARQNGWGEGGGLFSKAIGLLRNVFDSFSGELKPGTFDPDEWARTLEQIAELLKTVKQQEQQEEAAAGA